MTADTMTDAERPVGIVFLSAALSAIPTFGGPIQTLFDEFYMGRRGRMEQAAGQIVESVGQAQVIARLTEDSRLEALMGQALEAAARSAFDAKRRLLGKSVTSALLGDDAAVDTATLIVSALEQLEPMHIRALIRLEQSNERRLADPQGESIYEVHRTLTEPEVATLIFTGVVTPGQSAGPPMVVREITKFGRLLLAELRTVAHEEMERLAD